MSRPRRATNLSLINITFRVTLEEQAALRQIARENQTTVAEMVRDAVNDYVADYSDQASPLTIRAALR